LFLRKQQKVKKGTQRGGKPAQKIPLTEAARQVFVSRVAALAEPMLADEQMELVHIEYQREACGLTLRVFVDKPGGVKLDDCVRVSRQLGDLLDGSLDHELPYNLEVSSPGPNRPLSQSRDFERFKGHRAKIRLRHPRDGQKHFSGILMGICQDQVHLAVGQTSIVIARQDIAKAWLMGADDIGKPLTEEEPQSPRCDKTCSQGESIC
jgi:ribosome maturation factor RimP